MLGDPQAVYDVECEEDYADALRALVRNTHDVCILDHVTGASLTGIEVLKRANAGGCVTPVILMTRMADDDIEWAADDAGAAGWLNRDLDLNDRTVKHVIRYAISHFKQLQDVQDNMTELQKQLAEISRRLRR